MTGSPYKLKDDTWGLKVTGGKPEPGDPIDVTTKTGKTWVAEVSQVLASFDGDDGQKIYLCRTARSGGPPKAKTGCSCPCAACASCEHKRAETIPF